MPELFEPSNGHNAGEKIPMFTQWILMQICPLNLMCNPPPTHAFFNSSIHKYLSTVQPYRVVASN